MKIRVNIIFIIAIIIANLVFSQGIEWGKNEQIPVGYHYVIDSNSNGDIIVGGFELNSYYAMQIYYNPSE